MDLMTRALDLMDRAELDAGGDLDNLDDEGEKLNDSGGNSFQNENVYNRLLPYDTSVECREHLARIKTSIAKSILLDQETIYEWFIDLERFVDLYGLAFSKEDHIFFVKVQYELMVSKNSMDLYYIAYVARCFSRLMRKRYLISSSELVLDWRPLYETYERLLFSPTETLGLRFVPENLEANLSLAIRLARPHFPVGATQEMLDEWRPMLCPFNVSIQRAVTYLNLFLPTTLPPEDHDKGFKLWFDEVMQLWLSGKVSASTYESKFTLLLSRLSSDCMGYIDWEPYIPRIFNHFKSSLNLNGGSSRPHIRRHNDSVDVGPCVQWMVYMISRDNSCLEHISKLFKAIESFYHPSNTDRRWHAKLQQFLYKLPACYVKRLYRERYKTNIWSRRIPESHKLTDDLTTKLVDSLLPVVLTSMFNQSGISSAALAFRDLSVLRPEKVIPPLLDRLYGSYETLTEPHRLLASINCMASVVPAMVRPSKYFPDGPSHVVPLLLNSLPGIDSNDMRKCIAVFRFLASLAAHIRMKDYSYLVDERPNLTFEQQQLCLSTCQFEDFVIQFLDKCFVLIENTATATFSNLDQENHSKSGEEGIVEAAISSVALSILSQASPQIQQAALDKVYSHVTRHIFDTKTQGRAIATLCLACAKFSPKETLSKFVPHFGRLILILLEHDDVFQESILDEELLFSLLLMSEIVRCNSLHLLDHKGIIVQVLKSALKLKAKEGYMLGCSILRHLLRALTNITCCDWRNIDFEDEKCREAEERWPFDNWGHTIHIKDLKLKWEIPSDDARKFAQELLETFLKQAVSDLLEWSENKKQLAREEVQRGLHVILSSLVGAASVLPNLTSDVINLCPYEVPVVPMCVRSTGTDALNFEDGINVRTHVVESMLRVLTHICETSEDDTKSLTLICEIFSTAISYFGYNKTELRLAAQRIKSMKSSSQNKLLGSKRHLRYLLVERVAQQHRAMLLNKGLPGFTKLHLEVFNRLFTLSQGHYVEVRILAQDTVYMMLNYFPFLETLLVPMLVENLRRKEIEHKKFKGLLYLIVGRRSYSSVAVDPNWSFLRQLWPAIVESPHSEKLSIVKLLDRICNLVQKTFDTFELRYGFSESLKKLAVDLWSRDDFDRHLYPPPDEKFAVETKARVGQRNQKRINDYEQLILRLSELIEDPHLHWHRRIVAYSFFTHLMRDDHPLPLPALKLCVSCLISERLSIRLKAVFLLVAQLKLLKRKHSKRIWKASELTNFMQAQNPVVDLSQIEEKTKDISLSEGEAPSEQSSEKPGGQEETSKGLRNSNKWMQYKFMERSYNKEEWDKLVFIDKPHIGFYDWPKEVETYEPYDKQPQLNRPREDMNEYEQAIYDKFMNEEFVEKLVSYFCFEDNKGHAEVHRFDTKRPNLFKGLFRNYGPCMIEPFRKYVMEYSVQSCEQKQRFVIEFLAGLIRGSKHWSYEMMINLKDFVLPLLDQLNITQENFNDCTGLVNYVFRHRDINRFHWLFNHFINKALAQATMDSPTVTPFIQSSRLTLAHCSLIQCEWRAVDHIFPVIVDKLKPQDHLLSYANVRTCLASIYSLIYMFDDPKALTRIPGTLSGGPKRIDFIEYLMPKLAILEKARKASSQLSNSASDDAVSSMIHGAKSQEQTRSASSIVGGTSDMSIITETLLKLRQLETSHESPSESPPIHENRSDDRAKIAIEKNTGSSNASFVDFPTGTLPDLNIAASTIASISSGESTESEEKKNAIKLMKLTSCWIIYNVCRMKTPVPADFFKLLPLICEMGRESNDPELATDSLAAVAVLSSTTLSPEAVVESLLCVRKIIYSHSWHARVSAAAFIEIMVSSNLFKLISNEEWRRDIEDIVLNHLICDERIEVRESSSLTLSGMIHCEFTKLTPELLNEFKRRANEPLVKRKQPNGTTVIDSKSTVLRHSGIICLCACVDAYPYTVPEYLPEILTLLSDHLTDPQPISTTIKKTMSNFRRTHHDNWQSDKTKFTDDQLCILADLLVSPSYYA